MLFLILPYVLGFQVSLQTSLTSLVSFKESYTAALIDAQLPELIEIARNLTSLHPGNQNISYDLKNRIKMVFPINTSEIPSSGLITQYTDTFLYTPNDLKNACQGFDELRLKQLLGMSPEIIISGVVEVYVNASEIFRPCADPSIYDSECELSVMLINNDAGLGPCPWYCGENTEEQLSKLVTVKEEQFDWMCERWEISFGNLELYSNKPWTGLGYTYNWANDLHFGVSEFAVLAFTEVEIIEKYTVEEYCQSVEDVEI